MNNNIKNDRTYKTIGEVAKELKLIDKHSGNLQTHTLRYWETQFRQIKPSIRAGNRRYYSKKDFKIIKQVQFLLKEKGLTVRGAKKILNKAGPDSLDDYMDLRLYETNIKNTKVIKDKVKKISKIIRELKELK